MLQKQPQDEERGVRCYNPASKGRRDHPCRDRREKRPEPAGDVVEREIGGKTFNLDDL